MNKNDAKYTQFALCREMTDTVDVAKSFDSARTADVAKAIATVGRVMMTGEGSSRIFPAKNARRKALAWGLDLQIATDGSRQAATYDLSRFAAFLASNSGRTQEVVVLAKALQAAGHKHVYGLTANADTVLEASTTSSFVLTCGWEEAVAATKSVAEQAMLYQSIVSHVAGRDMTADLKGLDTKLAEALSVAIPADVVKKAVAAKTIYFAGYNDGVAEN